MKRYTDNQLLELLGDLESDGVEYKSPPDLYELYPAGLAQITDLSRVLFEQDYLPGAFAPDVLAENNRTYEERLASCKMIVSPTDTTPTIHGLLAIGKDPQAYISGAYIQFLRIDGVELADPVIDEEMISGAIPDMIRRIMEKIKAHNRRAVDVTSGAALLLHATR